MFLMNKYILYFFSVISATLTVHVTEKQPVTQISFLEKESSVSLFFSLSLAILLWSLFNL